jgi:hypothetical protein
MIAVLERAKTVRALDCSATVIGGPKFIAQYYEYTSHLQIYSYLELNQEQQAISLNLQTVNILHKLQRNTDQFYEVS